jgi:hypothetical protein
MHRRTVRAALDSPVPLAANGSLTMITYEPRFGRLRRGRARVSNPFATSAHGAAHDPADALAALIYLGPVVSRC